MEAYHALAQHVEFKTYFICQVAHILKFTFCFIWRDVFWFLLVMTGSVPTLIKWINKWKKKKKKKEKFFSKNNQENQYIER